MNVRCLDLRIFISSTYKDLVEERAAVISLVDRVEHAVAMEKFPAADHHATAFCLGQLQRCDVMILIIGERYGWIHPERKISITELEFQTAQSLGVHVLAFVKGGNLWRSVETDPEVREKHEAFKATVDSLKTRGSFSSVPELEKEVLVSIMDHMKRHGLVGARGRSFMTVEEFFKPWLHSSAVFNHLVPFVARQEYTDALVAFAMHSEKSVALLVGRGGIGKSRLLLEATRKITVAADAPTVRFFKEATFDREAIKELPSGNLIICVDDAHRIPTATLRALIGVAQQNTRIKLVISSRPYAVESIRTELSNAGVSSADLEALSELKGLDSKDVRRLATEVIGDSNEDLLDQLAALSWDSPLVTVIGGQLVAKDRIRPEDLATSTEFKELVFRRFADIVVGSVSEQIPSELTRKLLSLVAAIAPIRHEDENLVIQMAGFLSVPPHDVRKALSVLEQAGVLIRVGYTVRITPDVLSDHLLHSACFTPDNRSTGYADSLFEAFRGLTLDHLLRNLAELDWRLTRGERTALLGNIWSGIREWYLSASNSERLAFSPTLEKISYYQPSPILDVVDLAMEYPKPDEGSGYLRATHLDLVRSFPPVLRGVAHNIRYIRRAVDLLWRIGRDDSRQLNSHPDHGIRILQDLARYEVGKPLTYNQAVLDSVKTWLTDPQVWAYEHSPLLILKELLVKEGEETTYRSGRITVSPFSVHAQNTKNLRLQAAEVIKNVALVTAPSVSRLALETLLDGLKPPVGLLGRQVHLEEIDRWRDTDLLVLAAVEEILTTKNLQALYLAAEGDLRWVGRVEHLKAEIIRVLDKFPNDDEYLTLKVFEYGTHQWRFIDPDLDFDQRSALTQAQCAQVIEYLSSRFPTPQEIKTKLEQLHHSLRECGFKPESGYLMSNLGSLRPDLAIGLCELLLADHSSPLTSWFASVCNTIRDYNREAFIKLVQGAAASTHDRLTSAAATALSWQADPTDQEVELCIHLLATKDDGIRRTLLWGLSRWQGDRSKLGLKLLLGIDPGTNAELMDDQFMFLSEFTRGGARLEGHQTEMLLQRLLVLPEVSERYYHLFQFLRGLAVRDPIRVAKFFLERVKSSRPDIGPFRAVPYAEFVRFSTSSADSGLVIEALRLIRDESLEADSVQMDGLCNLFALFARDNSESAIVVLSEWVDSGEPDKIVRASQLLEEADENFVFSSKDFVLHCILAVEHKHPDQLTAVLAPLYRAALNRGGSGIPGEPMPHDVDLRDRAAEARDQCIPGTAAHQFYDNLYNAALDSIDRDLKHWEETER